MSKCKTENTEILQGDCLKQMVDKNNAMQESFLIEALKKLGRENIIDDVMEGNIDYKKLEYHNIRVYKLMGLCNNTMYELYIEDTMTGESYTLWRMKNCQYDFHMANLRLVTNWKTNLKGWAKNKIKEDK